MPHIHAKTRFNPGISLRSENTVPSKCASDVSLRYILQPSRFGPWEGDGYFNFGGGEAVNWLSSSVMVKRVSDLTLEQWLKEFDSLLDRDKEVRRQMAAPPLKKTSKNR
jgi:hypothetical protein